MEDQNIADMSSNFEAMEVTGRSATLEELGDNTNISSEGGTHENVPEENESDLDQPRQEPGTKRSGERSPTVSTPVKEPLQKRSRPNASPIKNADVNRSLFSGEPTQSQIQSQESASPLPRNLDHRLSECLCGHRGHLANHLRANQECVETLRLETELQYIKSAKKEAFIGKVALIMSSCPAPECPGGDHRQKLPEECFQWYRQKGGKEMGFRDTSTADNPGMKAKISHFLRNYRHRVNQSRAGSQSQASLSASTYHDESAMDRTENSETAQSLPCANGCSFEGSLARHQGAGDIFLDRKG